MKIEFNLIPYAQRMDFALHTTKSTSCIHRLLDRSLTPAGYNNNNNKNKLKSRNALSVFESVQKHFI